ncbi:hypothetical protein RJT34_16464 [Clitoria ternatea]|uniref:Uncharacterized protein n=1 Tax=Clitoria ternatea TaxID=43366 RepID=A0AAN9J8D7_CLITE
MPALARQYYAQPTLSWKTIPEEEQRAYTTKQRSYAGLPEKSRSSVYSCYTYTHIYTGINYKRCENRISQELISLCTDPSALDSWICDIAPKRMSAMYMKTSYRKEGSSKGTVYAVPNPTLSATPFAVIPARSLFPPPTITYIEAAARPSKKQRI